MGIVSTDFKTLNLDFTIYIDSNPNGECRYVCIPLKDVSEQIIVDYSDMVECAYDNIMEFDSFLIKDDYKEGHAEVTWRLEFPANRYGFETCTSTLQVKDIRLLNENRIHQEQLRKSREQAGLCLQPQTLVIELDGKLFYSVFEVEKELCLFLDEFLNSSYINSKDIRIHLLEMGYHFSPQEVAWLINQCDRLTLREKQEAWKSLMECSFDESIELKGEEDYVKRLHRFLEKYINVQNTWLERFMNPDHAVYTFLVHLTQPYESSVWKRSNGIYYSSYEKCLEALKMYAERYDEHCMKHAVIQITRNELDCSNDSLSHKSDMSVYLDQTYEIIRIFETCCCSEEQYIIDGFRRMLFDFPTPFKKGDVLYDRTRSLINFGSVPMVLESYQNCAEKGYDRDTHCDMWVSGYFQDINDGTVTRLYGPNYMNYEFFPQEVLMMDIWKPIRVISRYIKGEIDLADMLEAYNGVLERNFR